MATTAFRTSISGTGAATYVVSISKLSADQLAYFQFEAAKAAGINPRTGQPYPPFVSIDAEKGTVSFRTSLAITKVCTLPEPKLNSRGAMSLYPENAPDLEEALMLRKFAASSAPAVPAAVAPAAAPAPAVVTPTTAAPLVDMTKADL